MKNGSGRRLKRVEPRVRRDGFVVGRNRDKTQEHSAATVRARAGRDGTGREEPSQIHSAVGLRRIDRTVAVPLVRNINVNGGNMRPRRSQFHSRPDTPTPRLSPSDQNRAATPVPPSPFRKSASPYRGESAFGNPKLCAAATRGHLIQCLSNWVT